ncbi:hypothetical protein [Mycobacterium sp. DL592]|uniref:hypothetical protein n=1 Tax=Mycobacterium sp. DL592 TaxID=2675524 RepID=UPI0014211D52|nr:hypothetical protein [Mycobacterium sp. DL592]
MTVTARSYLTAGMAAVAVSALTIAPVHVAAPQTFSVETLRLSAAVAPLVQPVTTAAAALGLVSEAPKPAAAAPSTSTPQASVTASATSAGSVIINAYNAIEPWVAYGFELGQYVLGFIPGLWWVAPGISLVYYTAEPVVQSLVYSFAYLIDGNLAAIGPELAAGLNQAATNFINYGIAWIGSLVPLPPLPPFPPLPGAALTSPLAAAAGGKSADSQTDSTAPAEAPKAAGHSARGLAVKDTPTVAAARSAQVADTASTEPTSTDTSSPAAPKAGDNSSDNGGTGQVSTGTTKKSGSTGGSARAHKAKSSGE